MLELISAVEEMVLNTTQKQWQRAEASGDFLPVPKSRLIAKGRQDEAKERNDAARERGHGPESGRFHTHLLTAVLERPAGEEPADGAESGIHAIKTIFKYLKQQEPEAVAEVVPHYKQQETNNPDSKEPQKFKVILSLDPWTLFPDIESRNEALSPERIRRKLLEVLVLKGGKVKKMPVLWPEAERRLQAARLKTWQGQ